MLISPDWGPLPLGAVDPTPIDTSVRMRGDDRHTILTISPARLRELAVALETVRGAEYGVSVRLEDAYLLLQAQE